MNEARKNAVEMLKVLGIKDSDAREAIGYFSIMELCDSEESDLAELFGVEKAGILYAALRGGGE